MLVSFTCCNFPVCHRIAFVFHQQITSATLAADVVVIWARNLETKQINAFIVRKGNPGFKTGKIEKKIALRCVQNADIEMVGCVVPDSARLPGVNSFQVGRDGPSEHWGVDVRPLRFSSVLRRASSVALTRSTGLLTAVSHAIPICGAILEAETVRSVEICWQPGPHLIKLCQPAAPAACSKQLCLAGLHWAPA